MEALARNVVARYLAARNDPGAVRKYQQLIVRAEKDMALLPRLFKTYDNQRHGYRSQDPEKAKATKAKLQAKLGAALSNLSAAFKLAVDFSKTYAPTTQLKRRLFEDDFLGWLKKCRTALTDLEEAVTGDALSFTFLSYGLDGSYVRPGQNPLLDAHNAVVSLRIYWNTLIQLDPEPVNIPEGGSNEERFLAYLTPSIRRLAKQWATKLKRKGAIARPLVWLILDNVNASAASSIAESLLSDGTENPAAAAPHVTVISNDLGYAVVSAAVFGVALLEEVGAGSLARRLTTALADELESETHA